MSAPFALPARSHDARHIAVPCAASAPARVGTCARRRCRAPLVVDVARVPSGTTVLYVRCACCGTTTGVSLVGDRPDLDARIDPATGRLALARGRMD